jgi:D-arabinose 1-dehydrogenase-like Zn-dependent alcohol dehydrogenase
MSATMQAAFSAGGGVLELREVPVPQPDPGEVPVDVRACGICGSDLHQFARRWPQPEFVRGHEIAGEILAVGDGATGWSVGGRVCVLARRKTGVAKA